MSSGVGAATRRAYGASEARREVPTHPLLPSLRHLSPLGRRRMNAEWLVELHGAHTARARWAELARRRQWLKDVLA